MWRAVAAGKLAERWELQGIGGRREREKTNLSG